MRIFASRHLRLCVEFVTLQVKKNWMRFENKAAPKIAFFLVMHNLRSTSDRWSDEHNRVWV